MKVYVITLKCTSICVILCTLITSGNGKYELMKDFLSVVPFKVFFYIVPFCPV